MLPLSERISARRDGASCKHDYNPLAATAAAAGMLARGTRRLVNERCASLMVLLLCAPGAHAVFSVSGSGCELHSGGACVQSANHPADYGNGQSCSIELTSGAQVIRFLAFHTEASYDKLTINGIEYSGYYLSLIHI